MSLTYADAVGGRKARPYEVWVEKQAVALNVRCRGGIYSRPYGSPNTLS